MQVSQGSGIQGAPPRAAILAFWGQGGSLAQGKWKEERSRIQTVGYRQGWLGWAWGPWGVSGAGVTPTCVFTEPVIIRSPAV